MAFDYRHESGKWRYSVDQKSSDLLAVIEKYSDGGSILCLGCGSGSLARALKSTAFCSFRGIDLSRVAIAEASTYQTEKTKFEIGDIEQYAITENFKVIIFEESLYFVRISAHLAILQRCREHLEPWGVIILTTTDPTRFHSMQDSIRRNFDVVEDRLLVNSSRHLFVLR